MLAARSTLAMPLTMLRDRRAGEIQDALQVLTVARDQLDADRLRCINALTALARSHDLGVDARRALTAWQISTIAGWRRREEPLGVATARSEAVRLAKRILILDQELADNRDQVTRARRRTGAHAASILRETIEYAQQRSAFGKPIGSFQSVAFSLADVVSEIEVSQTFVDEAVLAHSRGQLDHVDASKAKLWASEVQDRILDACVQVYGGYGFMNEYRVARAWTDARVTRIWAGTNEIMRRIISRGLGLEDAATHPQNNSSRT